MPQAAKSLGLQVGTGSMMGLCTLRTGPVYPAGPLGTAAKQHAGSSLASRKALPESQNGRKTCLSPYQQRRTDSHMGSSRNRLSIFQLNERQGHTCTHMLTQTEITERPSPVRERALWCHIPSLSQVPDQRPRNFSQSVSSGVHGRVAGRIS